jgi:hypothetical protein
VALSGHETLASPIFPERSVLGVDVAPEPVTKGRECLAHPGVLQQA